MLNIYFILVMVLVLVIKLIANQIEYVGWIYLTNKQRKEYISNLKQGWGEDWKLALKEDQEKLQNLDSKWAASHISEKDMWYNKNRKSAKPDYSVIKNKSEVIMNLWSYYYNFMLCRKDLKYSDDYRIRVIYYARKVSSTIDILVAPQATGLQFWDMVSKTLEVMACKRAKKVDLNTLPEETQKRLRDAEREAA